MLISDYEQTYEWDQKLWEEHIESVCMMLGEYEGDYYSIAAEEIICDDDGKVQRVRPPWTLLHKTLQAGVGPTGSLQEKIKEFVRVEPRPELLPEEEDENGEETTPSQ